MLCGQIILVGVKTMYYILFFLMGMFLTDITNNPDKYFK